MKRLVLFVSVTLIAALVLGAFSIVSARSTGGEGKMRVLVQFQPGHRGAVEQALKGAGAEFHYAFDNLNAFAVSIPSTAFAGISHNPNVILVEEDVMRFPIGIEQSAVAAQPEVSLTGQVVPYGIDMVQARDVWDSDRDGVVDTGAVTGSNRTLCIIDSGLYTGHEDFQGLNVLGGYTTIADGWADDGSGHGSHVAGTIAAVNNTLGVLGVTPGTVKLYIVRVFGDDGAWAYSSTLIDAANHCASAGANVISMSLGGSRSNTTEQRGFDTLYSQGILSIAAAGNEGTTAYSYPASYASVVSVAAVDESKVVADFSQKNNQVELAAPGVGVLSTVPYIDYSALTVDGIAYLGAHVEYSARGTASGALADGGLCSATGDWAGKVVLCQRGDISFYDKVINVQNSGGAAAIIYNNVPGGFLGTLGEGYSSTIISLSLSQEDGLYLVANKLGSVGVVESSITQPASGYEYYDGTSMATPHASAVAALVWSADPTATNAEIRSALTATAEDLGLAGRDTSYGYGLVQAYDAIQYLAGSGGGTTSSVHIADLDATKAVSRNKWTATVTAKVVDSTGALVSGAAITGTWSGGYVGTGTCTTGATGTCSMITGSMKLTSTSVTFTVTNVSGTDLVYDAAANADPDGDSTGTVITVLK
ncbi:MAG: S8 family serine peptidase [Anaerolineae bacterium]|nr:S8 family serine peptidase [Anaerolineae bacterium]